MNAAFWTSVARGAIAGLVGGLLFGASMIELGVLPTVASLVQASSPLVGFLVHMGIAAIVGGGFGGLMWRQRAAAGESLFWGLAYGTLWWFLGPLTFLPLFLGIGLAWNVAAAQSVFASLLGHLLFGAGTGLAFALLRNDAGRMFAAPRIGPLVRGAIAGLLGAWLVGSMLDAQGALAALIASPAGGSRALSWTLMLGVGLLTGLTFALLYPQPRDGGGPALVRGTVYGFLWWVLGAMTLIPLVAGVGFAWTLDHARAVFATFPGFLLFGGVVGLLYHWLDRITRLLFSDVSARHEGEGAGTETLRALARGASAGLVGGMVFTVVMIQVGFLPTVASIVGATGAVPGFIVHMVIAFLIGASYGVLFRRQSYDAASALGWGLSYGLFWWVLGAMTLLPILLGFEPSWTVEVAAELLPSLVGHLGYGAGVGLVFHRLEARSRPWWVPSSRADAERVAQRKEQVLTSAPALWSLVVVIALIVPVVLSGASGPGRDPYSDRGYGGAAPAECPEDGSGYGYTRAECPPR